MKSAMSIQIRFFYGYQVETRDRSRVDWSRADILERSAQLSRPAFAAVKIIFCNDTGKTRVEHI